MKTTGKLTCSTLILISFFQIKCDLFKIIAGHTSVSRFIKYESVIFLDTATIAYITSEYDIFSDTTMWSSNYLLYITKRGIHSNQIDTLQFLPCDSMRTDHPPRLYYTPPVFLSSVLITKNLPPPDSFSTWFYNTETGETGSYGRPYQLTPAGSPYVAYDIYGNVINAVSGAEQYTLSTRDLHVFFYSSISNNLLCKDPLAINKSFGTYDRPTNSLALSELPWQYNNFSIMPVDRSRFLFFRNTSTGQTMILPTDSLDASLSAQRSLTINMSSDDGAPRITDINVSAGLVAAVFYNRFEIRTFTGDIVLVCKFPEATSKVL